ncbi:hypothetical protein [Pseudonocardia sp. KRD291]|uniref:hypothetical protein n=1 Tax=Pseudonocardia sp. KRD291 TaxID=2792007 RepID=UPI001C4A174D|nr:hypothetical protein [Pseudonocardia sp. KRD291]MBW0101750.1 hypothetical protein [Pseudonocardia sp. KRD291]
MSARIRATLGGTQPGVLGTVGTALPPALHAATSPDARAGLLYGPDGIGHLSGAPAEQPLYKPLRSTEDAARIWRVSEELTALSFPVVGVPPQSHPVARPDVGA